jgi:hypothetical protein
MKEESFECRDARIRTRDLEYRNQTWSVRDPPLLDKRLNVLTLKDSSKNWSINLFRQI